VYQPSTRPGAPLPHRIGRLTPLLRLGQRAPAEARST